MNSNKILTIYVILMTLTQYDIKCTPDSNSKRANNTTK